jgi:hypothetical protein
MRRSVAESSVVVAQSLGLAVQPRSLWASGHRGGEGGEASGGVESAGEVVGIEVRERSAYEFDPDAVRCRFAGTVLFGVGSGERLPAAAGADGAVVVVGLAWGQPDRCDVASSSRRQHREKITGPAARTRTRVL